MAGLGQIWASDFSNVAFRVSVSRTAGLTTKQLGQYEESQYGSLHVFKKLQSMIPARATALGYPCVPKSWVGLVGFK